MTTVSTNPFEQLSAPWPTGWRIVHVYTQQELSDDNATAEWSLVLDDGEREFDYVANNARYYGLDQFAASVVQRLYGDGFIGLDQLLTTGRADALARDIVTALFGTNALAGVEVAA